MSDAELPLYEAMFLLPAAADSNLDAARQHIEDIFRRAEAKILLIRRWDARKLAYPVKGQKRGVYILALFYARGSQIANIERDCVLSEQILRALVTRCDHVGDTEIAVELREPCLPIEDDLKAEMPEGVDSAMAALAAQPPEPEESEPAASEYGGRR